MIRFVAMLALGICFIGCSGETEAPKPKSIVPVTGTVTLDGKPLDFARVTFVPLGGTDQGFGGSGSTDSVGKYELRSLIGTEAVVGAPPGEYKVTVNRMVKPDGTVVSPDSQEPPMMSAAKPSVPVKYMTTSLTPLKMTVSSSGGTYNLDLKTN